MQRRRQPQSRVPDDLAVRRLRLISDIMEDYQENIRRTIRLLEMELAFANDSSEHQANERTNNASEWARGQAETNGGRFASNQFPRYDPFRTLFRQTGRQHSMPQQQQPPATRFRRANYPDLDRDRGGYTNEEIDQVAETMLYTESMGEIRCPITWDNITPGQDVVRLRGCGHVFSSAGIREWFQRNRRCPVCRAYPTRVSPPSQENDGHPIYGLSTTMLLEDPSGLPLTAPQFLNTRLFQYAALTPTIRDAIAPPSSPTHNPSPAQRQSSSQQTTPMNTLLEGIVGVLSDAITDGGGPFEREFTFNLNDLLGSANITTLPRGNNGGGNNSSPN